MSASCLSSQFDDSLPGLMVCASFPSTWSTTRSTSFSGSGSWLSSLYLSYISYIGKIHFGIYISDSSPLSCPMSYDGMRVLKLLSRITTLASSKVRMEVILCFSPGLPGNSGLPEGHIYNLITSILENDSDLIDPDNLLHSL